MMGMPRKAYIDYIDNIEQEDYASLIGSVVDCKIDWQKRYAVMKLHTAAHLLCATLPYPINGCHISNSAVRMDFVTSVSFDKDAITQHLNALVNLSYDVQSFMMDSEELKKNQSMIRTINSMPPLENNQVRIVKIGDIDVQPCGGTHVKNTAEIGQLEGLKTKKVSASSRRISVGLSV